MLGSLLSGIGGAIGKCFGGGILSTIGKYAGNALGNYIDKKLTHRDTYSHKFTNAKDAFYVSTAEYGAPIPLIFGRMRIEGQIIWTDRITEKYNSTSTNKYFANKNITHHKEVTNIEYYANFAMALCEGEIAEIGRVWYNDQTISLSGYNFRLYKGDEEQLPDKLIESSSENAHATAHRGLAYIVFEKLPLADFGDKIPNLSFEITRKANIEKNISKKRLVEDVVKDIIMIPGSGEYVYDTIIQKKSIIGPSGNALTTNVINSHNHYNIANSIYSLNQLQLTCPNIKWVSPVVCWFGNSIDAKDCIIKPAVEFKDDNISYSEEWKVAGYTRADAYEIRKDENNNPIYGGSVNDASVVRYLIEIRRRGLKIMFYPMFFLDVERKPWRGHVTSEPRNIRNFFQRKAGYNEFILHYANLVKNHVDAFVIGSELIGLTRVRDGYNFPAVNELIELAKKVKNILGPNVLVTYAADWSEYHHTKGGWYNLDPLWASPYIDFVGIDAYFPATDSISSIITPDELEKGWKTGEGYEYYINHEDGSKTPLAPEYAWKNLRYWWENTHINPGGRMTEWRPKSKKIWFTEFGFPSIDKSSNQPNLFFDPKCIDGGAPRHSNGRTDFAIQRQAIRAFIEYWETQEYIEKMFLWTWDARPYPAWPHMKFWRDGNLWEKGHWVNNKFGSTTVASIILEISKKCLIDIDNVEVRTLDEVVEGFIISNQSTAIEAINKLRASYFFDITANNGNIITFEKRGLKQEINLNSKMCLKMNDNNFIEEVEIPKEATLNLIDLYFIDKHKEYGLGYVYS